MAKDTASSNKSAHLSLKGKNRSFNTPIPKKMDGDASKENWRDKEVQEDIKKRGLFELVPRIFIDPAEVEKIDTLLANFHEPTYDRSIILTSYIKVAELRTKSGLIVSSEGTFDHQFSAKHGSELPPEKHPSKLAVVLSVGKNVTEKPKRGDIVRFWPIAAMQISVGVNHVVLINESHLQTFVGHYEKK